MRGYLKMAGAIAFLWVMVPLGPHLESVLDWLIPRLIFPVSVGCVLGVIIVYAETIIRGLIQLRSEAEQRSQSEPSAAA
ncbi:MAG: hypothetical protein HY975_03730 [Candidatus Kerfeldbacteria bacterium]|nr:hypothetical protein [Candidatus Kerfeldbacteria bacterium]